MKAIVTTQYGSPDVLRLEEVRKPTPKDDEVLVKVHAASINSWDWDILRGKPFLTRLGSPRRPQYSILGADIAGRVEAVGKDVTRLRPGDAVFGDISGCHWGGFAEYVCASEDALAIKPTNMTFEEAAAFPQAGVLALQGLRYDGALEPEQKVLINGAGGGVGTFAIQLAKHFGAEVTGVDSTGKLDTMRSLGADHVIDYTQQDFTQNGQRYDLILDVVANRSVSDYKRVLGPNGVMVVVGGSLSSIFQTVTVGTWHSKTGSVKMGLLLHKPNVDDLNLLAELFEIGFIVPVIDRRYPLSETADAFRYFGRGDVEGKVVITTQ